jgi:thymidylate kinase
MLFRKRKIIAISGISGSGKSTIASILAIILGGIHIDMDSYYKKNKPPFKLSNGLSVSNWDSLESIDLEQMNKDLRIPGLVILSGFALSDDVFEDDNKPDVHIHLVISKELSLQTRAAIKNFEDIEKANQILVFNELLYPFYQLTLSKSIINININVESDIQTHTRRTPNDLLDEIVEYLKIKLDLERFYLSK